MDDAMLDLMADQGGLRRRLDAYAETRLSPDLAATIRMRARVLAVAHRQSALARSDATLALVSDPIDLPRAVATNVAAHRSRHLVRRGAAVLLAAGLALASVSTVALAARPGGALYGARVWAETLTLPTEPRQRAIAELDRLDERLAEAAAASASRDTNGTQAALSAYQLILGEAAADAEASNDEIAELTLQEGVANNIEVLAALVDRLPANGSQAVEDALERAIDRSQEAVDSIKPGNGSDGSGNDAGGNDDGIGVPGVPGGPDPTDRPAATDAEEPTATPKPTKTPKPTATPEPAATPKPTATPEPAATPKPAVTSKPDPTQRPERTPRPTPDQGGAGGGPGEDGGSEATSRPTPPGQGD